MFTVNNPDRYVDFHDDMQFLVYQQEVGEMGTPHYQGYCELKKQLSLSSIKKIRGLERAHIEPRRGTQQQAIDYCTKLDTYVDGPWRHGEPKNQGSRSDLNALAHLARSGANKRKAFEEMPAVYLRNYKAFGHVQTLFKPSETERRVTLLYGPPGSGKTRYVMDKYPDAYFIPVTSKELWFDGYDGHEVACIDDFAGQIPLLAMLRIIDRYVCQVQVKGGFVWWNPKQIFVTSNYTVDGWYDYTSRMDSLEALNRRFNEVIYFPQ